MHYNDYNTYLRNKYGTKVQRIGIDAGFSCPNRDGTKGKGGCIYCNDNGSRASYADKSMTVADQLRSRISLLRSRGITKYIAYFQAFTNTYAPHQQLRRIYDEIRRFDGIVGLTIGTRPDTLGPGTIDLIASYTDSYEVWIEFGLQSTHDRTLASLHRAHTYADFENAAHASQRAGIKVCAHVILGLPGETRQDMIETATKLAALQIDGVKLHVLHVLKGSALEGSYKEGKVKLLEEEEYVRLACDFLEQLPASTLIQRITAQGSREDHVAPAWAINKTETIRKIKAEFEKRGTCQGSKLFLPHPSSIFPRASDN